MPRRVGSAHQLEIVAGVWDSITFSIKEIDQVSGSQKFFIFEAFPAGLKDLG